MFLYYCDDNAILARKSFKESSEKKPWPQLKNFEKARWFRYSCDDNSILATKLLKRALKNCQYSDDIYKIKKAQQCYISCYSSKKRRKSSSLELFFPVICSGLTYY